MSDDLFDLEDFNGKEITTSPPEPEKSKSTDTEKKEIPDTKDTNELPSKEEEIKEKKDNPPPEEETKKETNEEKVKANEPKEEKEDNSDESDDDNINEEDEAEKDDSVDIKEKEEQEKMDFQTRHKNMQKWAIEDNIDIKEYDNIKDPPIKFSFTLDEFQKRSIIRLEKHQNVLVCAHTSSGKTVVAEYGIALGKRHAKRVLYTSPIKALSNQKYREFKKRFDDVGILTGDVSINPEAQCLIMTTEILQSSLYKNSELLNQVEWVVFDEVHYINDNERGHVWEEILILLPKGIGIIMLSATVPNYMEFAQWVGDIKETNVYVQNTLKRIVPLQHQLYIDKKNVYKVKEKDEIFEEKIKEAFNCLQNMEKGNKYQNYKKRNQMKNKEDEYIDNILYFEKFKKKKNKRDNWNKKNYNNYDYNYNPKITKLHHKIDEIVDYLDSKDLCPAVIFVFSIKKITEYAKMLSLKNLVSTSEKNEIKKFYRSVINSMPKEDQNIPQVKELEEILVSGIGMHHSGLLPILKETIEILYSRGLLKILFATTSFSIGLNMPTRTVVFTDLYKFNDSNKEILSSSEYLQMCGRAGRRGIDSIGNIFILLTELSNKNEKNEIIGMLKGVGTEVESKFRICYRTLLSFFSRNIKDMDEFFRESFLESNLTQKIPDKIAQIEISKAKQKKLSKTIYDYSQKYVYNDSNLNIISENKINDNKIITIENKNDNQPKNLDNLPIALFYKSMERFKELSRKIFMNEKLYQKLALHPGRILKVHNPIFFKRKNPKYRQIDSGIYVILIQAYQDTSYYGTLWCLGLKGFIPKNKRNTKNTDIVVDDGTYGKYQFFYKEYHAEDIIDAYESPFNIKFPPKKNDRTWKKTKDDYFYIIDRTLFDKVLKELTPLYYLNKENHIPTQETKFISIDIKLISQDLDYQMNIQERNKILEESRSNKCLICQNFYQHFKDYEQYEQLRGDIEKSMGELNPENLEHYREFKTRLNILQDLKYVTEDNTLTLKGKAAREIGTSDCVLMTELLTSDILTSLTDGEVIGFISGFASNKNEINLDIPYISKKFGDCAEKFTQIYENVAGKEKNYNFEESKYNRRMTFEFSKAMLGWMEGQDFWEILDLTELEEGKLYNLIMRIFLMLEEIGNFYSMLGNVEQSKRFLELKNKLMRGIMALQSLYLQDKIDIDAVGDKQKKK